MFSVELLAEAEEELSEAYDWYEEQLHGLGGRFYNEADHHLSLLEQDPLLFPVRYQEELRALPLKKFPFLLIYWVDTTNFIVYVLSVFHTSRNPSID